MPTSKRKNLNTVIPSGNKRKDLNNVDKKDVYHGRPATIFFHRKVIALLIDRKKNVQQKTTALANADLEFRNQYANSLEGNFWKLLDEELFFAKQEIFQKQSIDNLPKQPIQCALGLLEVVASGGALNREIFNRIVSVYKDAYQETEHSLLTKALDYSNSNLLHIVCSVLASHAESDLIKKDHWSVYKSLKENECYSHLFEEVDKYGRTPVEFLENADLILDNDHQIFYAVSRLKNDR